MNGFRISLEKFRSVLASEIDADVADSLFGLAAALSVSAMARSCEAAESGSNPQAIGMEDVAELFILTRGVRDVIAVTRDHIVQGPMSALFPAHSAPEGMEITLSAPVESQFDALQEMLEGWGLDPEALEHCHSALRDLHEIYENVVYWGTRGHVETGQVVRWMKMVSTEFVRLIQARCQPALVIFAYFAAASSAVRTAWYIENWGEYCIWGVSLELEDRMQHFIEWPREKAEQRMAALGIKAQEPDDSLVKPIVGFGT
ncbi:hypothetical protein LTR37_013164 [Vermiconidia calcicola]|uniref:Uncharacterized protein n=1 Tax=Vermiconidia calcicola TaxID=1690605 RepID=A0ACC3MYE2_9PEZI|nr:hypothetical protein LTR37_013164 [Vermiconidia calcicola]